MKIGKYFVVALASGVVIAVVFALVLINSYSAPSSSLVSSNGIIGNQKILDEMSRLSALSSEGNLNEKDLEMLEAMVKGDEAAEHETEEVGILVKYGEYEHATHALAFFSSYIATGEQTICPGHELAHYYVFTKHGEDEAAEHALEEAEENMEEWEPKARKFAERYPSDMTFDEIVEKVEGHLASIKSGNTETTEGEIDFPSREERLRLDKW